MLITHIKIIFKQKTTPAMGFFKTLMSVISTDGKTGTPFKLDKNHTVYYKGNGVTELDAAHVAGFFKGYGYFTE